MKLNIINKIFFKFGINSIVVILSSRHMERKKQYQCTLKKDLITSSAYHHHMIDCIKGNKKT